MEEILSTRTDLQVIPVTAIKFEIEVGQKIHIIECFKASDQRFGNTHIGFLDGRCSFCGLPFARFQEFIKFRCRNRLGEVITLNDITAHCLQYQILFFGFYAFCDNRYMEVIRNIDDQFNHAHIFGFSKGVAHKGHIQLEGINRQMCQHPQRGISGSKVIHFNTEAHAHAAQFTCSRDDLLTVTGIGRFRDFKNDVICGQIVFVQNILEDAFQVWHQHINS